MDRDNKEKIELHKGKEVYYQGKKGIVRVPGDYRAIVEFEDGSQSVDVDELSETPSLETKVKAAEPKDHTSIPKKTVLGKVFSPLTRLKRRKKKKIELTPEPESDELTKDEIDVILEEHYSGRAPEPYPYKPIKTAYEIAQERARAEPKPVTRRKFLGKTLVRGIEFAALLPAFGFAAWGFVNRKSYHKIDFAYLQDQLQEHKKAINSLEGTMASVGNDLQNLWSLYKRHYEDTEIYWETTLDSEGNPVRRQRTRTVWRVPAGLPNQNTVRSWKNSTAELLENIKEVKNHPIYDFKKKSAKITKEHANTILEGLMTAGVYGLPALALLGYEEAFEWLSDAFGSGRYEASKEMSRRNFFKLGAALCGIAPAAYFMNKHANRNENAGKQAEEQIKRIIGSVKNAPDSLVISQVIGVGPDAMQQRMDTYKQIAKQASGAGVRQGDVTAAFSSLHSNSKNAETGLGRMFANGVPKELAMPMRNAYGKKMADEFNSSGHGKIYTDKLIEGGVFAGVLALVMGGYEFMEWNKRS